MCDILYIETKKAIDPSVTLHKIRSQNFEGAIKHYSESEVQKQIDTINNKHELEYKESMLQIQNSFDETHDLLLERYEKKINKTVCDALDEAKELFIFSGVDVAKSNRIIEKVKHRYGNE